MKSLKCLAAVLTSVLCLQAQAMPYSISSLGEGFNAISINNAGQILGVDAEGRDILSNPDGTRVVLAPLPGGAWTTARGMNDLGLIVGSSVSASGRATGAIFTDGQPQAFVPTLGGSYSILGDVNNAGWITGISATSGNLNAHAFIFNGTAMQDLGSVYGYGSNGHVINEAGQVAGETTLKEGNVYFNHAMIWSNGVMRDLGTFGGRSSSTAGMNDGGVVIGSAQTAAGASHAFMYANGVMTDLGAPAGGSSYARAINNQNAIVGWNVDASFQSHPFMYDQGNMIDLSSLVDPGSGWVLAQAEGINDNGQIVGYGYLNGRASGFLMTINSSTEVPEPTSVMIIGLGFAALLRVRSRAGTARSQQH